MFVREKRILFNTVVYIYPLKVYSLDKPQGYDLYNYIQQTYFCISYAVALTRSVKFSCYIYI